MAIFFAHRRREVIEDRPFIAEFQKRWPALFSENQVMYMFFLMVLHLLNNELLIFFHVNFCVNLLQVNTEFTRITTIPLLSTFMGQLDHYSSQLMKVFKKKGGAPGRRINQIMVTMDQVCVFSLKP